MPLTNGVCESYLGVKWYHHDLNSFPFGELKTTRMPSYYVDKRLSSKIWNPITSPWMKQSMWLRIVHSGHWCLCLAPHTPNGACHTGRRMLMYILYLIVKKQHKCCLIADNIYLPALDTARVCIACSISNFDLTM